MVESEERGPHILLVEDSESIQAMLLPHFQLEGLRLTWISDGAEGLAAATMMDFQLLILDIQLPGIGGVEICRRVRAVKPQLPIIMLTSRSDEINKVIALDAGADDFVTKPFGIQELLARIRARIRATLPASSKSNDDKELRFGDLTIDPGRRQVRRGDTLVELTKLEFDLLILLVSHAGRPCSLAMLLREAWGVEAEGYEENVSQVVRRLRQKIEPEPDKPKLLITVRGVGYVFSEPF